MAVQGDTRDCPGCKDGTQQKAEIGPDPEGRSQGLYPKSVLMWRCPKGHIEVIR